MLKEVILVCLVACTYGQGLSSCVGRCDNYVDHSYTCQCNTHCTGYGDCCDDYFAVCENDMTCAGRCDTSLDNTKPCQCNSWCVNYGDCCPDYDTVCNSPGGGGGTCSPQSISNNEILQITKELWQLDSNRATQSEVVVNPQAQVSSTSTQDQSPLPFFTSVDPAVLQRPTFKALVDLLDNYEKMQGINEQIDQAELDEDNAFLDLVLATPVGQRLYEFLDSKNRAGCSGMDTFKDYLRRMWFEMYSRRNGAMDTSGFEHVFVGEIKSTYVSGFHGWVQFYLKELTKDIEYYGYVSTAEPGFYGQHFTWDGYMKELGGIVVGASPEMELAFFTICHMARPNSLCTVQVQDYSGNWVTRQIQTYTWNNSNPGDGLEYIGSAYFRV